MALQVTPSRMFLGFCAGLFLAIFLATGTAVPLWVAWATALIGAIFVVFGWPRHAAFGSRRFFIAAAGFLFLGIALGFFRVDIVRNALTQESITPFSGQEVEVLAHVTQYPSQRSNNVRFIADVESVGEQHVRGRVLVFTDRSADIAYGDTVVLEGKIRIPEPFDNFDYPAFLAKDGIVATMQVSDVRVTGSGGSWWGRALASSRVAIDRTTLRILPYKEGALLKALLLGDESSLSEATKTDLNRAGLRHIVAVSGMNITIIASILSMVALALGLWRRQAFFAGAGTIAVFVALIGAPASAVRAALMGISLRAAPILGRFGSGFRPAFTAAAAMVFVSPFTLRLDVGFQLSFLAVLGIIFLGPAVSRWLSSLPKLLRETLAMTIAAQFAVLPLLVSVFGQVSVVSPFTNLFVVPALVVVTIWGFVAVAFGMLFPTLGMVAALPLFPYFSFVGWLARTSAAFPWATATIPTALMGAFSLFWYSVMVVLAWREAKRTPRPIDQLRKNKVSQIDLISH